MTCYSLFTDVSLNPKTKIGMGAYLVLPDSYLETVVVNIDKNVIESKLKLKEFFNTSSTKLEVQTALLAIDEFTKNYPIEKKPAFSLYTDSQCIIGLPGRRKKLEEKNYISTSKNEIIKNAEIYKKFYECLDIYKFKLVKVVGHSPKASQETVTRIFSIIDRFVRKEFRQ